MVRNGKAELGLTMETEPRDRILKFMERVQEMREAQKQHLHLHSTESLYKVLVLERIVDDERCLIKAILEMDKCQLSSEKPSSESATSAIGDSSRTMPGGQISRARTAAS